MIVGLTGKFCTGKNRVGGIMSQQGWDVIDVDHLGHAALKHASEPLLEFFGEGIRKEPGGRISRRKLAERVFNDPANLAFLESVLHPEMVRMCHELIEGRDTDRYPMGTVLNAAILHKMRLNLACDAVLYVQASTLIRFIRATSSRGMPVLDFIRRNRVQRSIAPKYFFDGKPLYVIMNNHGDSILRRQLAAFYRDRGIELGD